MGNLHRKKRKERALGRKMAERAWELLERRGPREAEAAIRQALASREGDCVLWNDLGLILWRKGDLRDAEKAFRNAILVRPGYEDGMANLAALLAERGFHRQAHKLEVELASFSPRADFHRKRAAELLERAEEVSRGAGEEPQIDRYMTEEEAQDPDGSSLSGE